MAWLKRGKPTLALDDAVEQWLPAHSDASEPAWTILMLPLTPKAPIVTISRDARSGPRLTPVFFVGVADHATLLPIGASLYGGTGQVAKLFHTAGVSPEASFLVIPALYHVDNVDRFSREVERYLESISLGSLTWIRQNCEVRLEHDGKSYRAIRGADGGFQIREQG